MSHALAEDPQKPSIIFRLLFIPCLWRSAGNRPPWDGWSCSLAQNNWKMSYIMKRPDVLFLRLITWVFQFIPFSTYFPSCNPVKFLEPFFFMYDWMIFQKIVIKFHKNLYVNVNLYYQVILKLFDHKSYVKKASRKHTSSNLWSNHKAVSKQWSKHHKVVWCILTTCSAQCLGIKCTLHAEWWMQETHVAPKTEETHVDIKTKSWNHFF